MPRKYQFPFELRHLIYFQELAAQLHFRKASETLSVAQPALSRQIAQLESALGLALFTRTRRKVELTEAGQALKERLEPFLRGLSGLTQDLQSLAQGQQGRVRIAFTGLAMATVVPRIIREFHRRYPGIRLEMKEAPTSSQVESLLAGDLSCGFYHPDAPAPGIQTRLLLKERNGVLLPADHRLAARHTLRLAELADTPFVLFPRAFNPGFYDRILAAFLSAGVTPRIEEEVWPRANGIGLVCAGLGATFMCPSEARQVPPELVFRRLTGPAPESRLVMGWRELPAPSPALSAFLAVARELTAGSTKENTSQG